MVQNVTSERHGSRPHALSEPEVNSLVRGALELCRAEGSSVEAEGS